jgi:3-isopropylmalate/(R)-2-methylmalate dehydratase large subunit
MFDKIWTDHSIRQEDDGSTLLFIGRHLAHDGSYHAFNSLKDRGLRLHRPDQTFATPDHGISTLSRRPEDIVDPVQRRVVEALKVNAATHGFTHFGLDDPRQGIIHVVGPELGLTQPGLLLVCGDSHTSTHGALGALAFGIGASDVCHVFATQTLWQRKPKTMRVVVVGRRPASVTAKDVILAIIARIGANGASNHVIEYAGPTITDMSIEERLTVCNMSIEAGARAGIIAPDEKTYGYLRGRPFAPSGRAWNEAEAYWRTVPSDPGARFDREVVLEATNLEPMITWGTTPADVVGISGTVPDPMTVQDPSHRGAMQRSLHYMGLAPGMPVRGVPIDQVFIGSCTNARIEDLRAAAVVAKQGSAVVPAIVSPGSTQVKRQAEAEGLADIFRKAGFDWRESGCSMCCGMNGDLVGPGKRCASTSNRNFPGRQGIDSRTHLMSPVAAAAAALRGCIADPREFGGSS